MDFVSVQLVRVSSFRSDFLQNPYFSMYCAYPYLDRLQNFPKTLADLVSLIIIGIKITNTGNFLWNGLSKIQFFTNIRQSL